MITVKEVTIKCHLIFHNLGTSLTRNNLNTHPLSTNFNSIWVLTISLFNASWLCKNHKELFFYFHLQSEREETIDTVGYIVMVSSEDRESMYQDRNLNTPLGKTSTDVERTPYFGPVWKFSGRPYASRT